MRFRSGLGLVESKVASICPSRQSAPLFFSSSTFQVLRHVTRPDQSLLADKKKDTRNEVKNPHLEDLVNPDKLLNCWLELVPNR